MVMWMASPATWAVAGAVCYVFNEGFLFPCFRLQNRGLWSCKKCGNYYWNSCCKCSRPPLGSKHQTGTVQCSADWQTVRSHCLWRLHLHLYLKRHALQVAMIIDNLPPRYRFPETIQLSPFTAKLLSNPPPDSGSFFVFGNFVSICGFS